MNTLQERIEQAGREAYMGQNMPMIDHAADCALAGARAALEDLEAVYVAWLRLEEADEKGHWQPVQVALNGVRSRLTDLSPFPAVKRADDELLRIAKDFVVLANTIWDNSPDGARAKELSEERMGNLARRIMEWPAHEGPSPAVEHTCHDMNPPHPYPCAACESDKLEGPAGGARKDAIVKSKQSIGNPSPAVEPPAPQKDRG